MPMPSATVTLSRSPLPTARTAPGSHGPSEPPPFHSNEPSWPVTGSPPSAASEAAGGSAENRETPPDCEDPLDVARALAVVAGSLAAALALALAVPVAVEPPGDAVDPRVPQALASTTASDTSAMEDTEHQAGRRRAEIAPQRVRSMGP